MPHIRLFLNSVNYLFYCFYSFTFIDVVKKLIFDEFHITNVTSFFQLLLTIIGVFFAYYKMLAYKRDAKIKSKMLEQDQEEKEIALFYKRNEKQLKETELLFKRFKDELIDPFKDNNI